MTTSTRYANTRYTYLRNHVSAPHTCVAIKVHASLNQIHFAMATCNPEDTFSKKMARFIVDGRLEKTPHIISSVDCSNLSGHDIAYQVMKRISTLTSYNPLHPPKRVLSAANIWLDNHSKRQDDKGKGFFSLLKFNSSPNGRCDVSE